MTTERPVIEEIHLDEQLLGLVVTHDGEPSWAPREACCVCREPTHFWYVPLDIALCQSCAHTSRTAELPTKQEWVERERTLARHAWFAHRQPEMS